MPSECIEEVPAHGPKFNLDVVTFIVTVAGIAREIATATSYCGSVARYCNVHVRILKQICLFIYLQSDALLFIIEPRHEKTCLREFPTRSDSK